MPFKHNSARRHRIPKQKFKVTNWAEYEAGLRQRGSVTFWISEAAIAGWIAPLRKTRGGQCRYSDLAIYLYRAIHSSGNTVEFLFNRNRGLLPNALSAKALAQHGRPDKITIDGSQANRTAITQCDAENRLRDGGKPITIRSSKYMNNAIEQDHHRVKRRIRCILGFESEAAASVALAGIELVQMMRKLQGNFRSTAPHSIKQQFTALAA